MLLTNQSFTTVAPTGEIGKQYEAVDAQGNVRASAFLADRAAFDKFVADNPGTTIREAVTQELGDEVLLYNPNDLNAPPVRERVGTPTYNTRRVYQHPDARRIRPKLPCARIRLKAMR
jgi:CelD/BcsL family acetyltransferase involved in cellulose biosynthesis